MKKIPLGIDKCAWKDSLGCYSEKGLVERVLGNAHFEEEWDQWQDFLWSYKLDSGQKVLVIESRHDDGKAFVEFLVDTGEPRDAQVALGFKDLKIWGESDKRTNHQIEFAPTEHECSFAEWVFFETQKQFRGSRKYVWCKRAIKQKNIAFDDMVLNSESMNDNNAFVFVLYSAKDGLFRLTLTDGISGVASWRRLWIRYFLKRANRIDARMLKTARAVAA